MSSVIDIPVAKFRIMSLLLWRPVQGEACVERTGPSAWPSAHISNRGGRGVRQEQTLVEHLFGASFAQDDVTGDIVLTFMWPCYSHHGLCMHVIRPMGNGIVTERRKGIRMLLKNRHTHCYKGKPRPESGPLHGTWWNENSLSSSLHMCLFIHLHYKWTFKTRKTPGLIILKQTYFYSSVHYDNCSEFRKSSLCVNFLLPFQKPVRKR